MEGVADNGTSSSGHKKHSSGAVRLHSSSITNHMCFFCGSVFTQSMDYQRHVVHEHQAASLCYQLYVEEVDPQKRQHVKVDTNKGNEEQQKKRESTNARGRPPSTKRSRLQSPIEQKGISLQSITPVHPIRRSIAPSSSSVASSSLPSTPLLKTVFECPICKDPCGTGMSVVRHCVREHNTEIAKMVVTVFTLENEKHRVPWDTFDHREESCTLSQQFLDLVDDHKNSRIFKDSSWASASFQLSLQYEKQPAFEVVIRLKNAMHK